MTNEQPTTHAARTFDELLDDLDLVGFSQDVQEEFLQRFSIMLFENIMSEVMLRLSEEEQEEVLTLAESEENAMDNVMKYLDDHIKDLDSIAKEQADALIERREEIEKSL